MFVVYKNTGSRVLNIPYGNAPTDVSWHRYVDDVVVTLEVGSKISYIKKFHSTWKYKTPNEGSWWYTHDGYHDTSNAMRWYYDETNEAIVIEYYHRSNADDDILTRRELLFDISRDTIWR